MLVVTKSLAGLWRIKYNIVWRVLNIYDRAMIYNNIYYIEQLYRHIYIYIYTKKKRRHNSISVYWKLVFFFVTDHLLVGQLCTNPKSDSNLLSFLKMTQCSTVEIGDALLYNLCSLSIQVMSTGPLPAPSKYKSGRFNAWGHSSTHRTTLWWWLWWWWWWWWWSGSPRLRTPPGRPGPRSSSKRFRQSLMKLPSGLFGRLPEV